MEDLKDLELEAQENNGLRVNIKKTKVMLSRSQGKLLKCKIDPCGMSGRIVMANSVTQNVRIGFTAYLQM